MQVDVNTFLGRYPFHRMPERRVDDLLREMARVGTGEAWVSHLGAISRGDVINGNAALYAASEAHPEIRPVPSVRPAAPDWISTLDEAVSRDVPAVRCDPTLVGLAPDLPLVPEMLAACAARKLPLMMAVRLEDLRQRDPADVATDLPPWTVRQLIRSHPAAKLVITHADRDFIEQVHFGSTPSEASRILWDISWIWGPPEDHLELLLGSVGIDRFTFGTGMPLRLPETSIAKLDLLDLAPAARERLTSGNLRAF